MKYAKVEVKRSGILYDVFIIGSSELWDYPSKKYVCVGRVLEKRIHLEEGGYVCNIVDRESSSTFYMTVRICKGYYVDRIVTILDTGKSRY